MNWSTELPTKSGWYWYKLHEWEEGEPVRVEKEDNRFYVIATWGYVNWGNHTPLWSGQIEPPTKE